MGPAAGRVEDPAHVCLEWSLSTIISHAGAGQHPSRRQARFL